MYACISYSTVLKKDRVLVYSIFLLAGTNSTHVQKVGTIKPKFKLK